MHSVLRLGFALTFLSLFPFQGWAEKNPSVAFHWFEYSGSPAIDSTEPAEDEYRNPILAGFFPDPSICRVGDDFYLVNSTFAWWPGIPVFHSRDLVHWEQIGTVINRKTQADFKGLGVSRGVFAPTIRYYDGLFYVVTTLVDGGENCFFTAKDPAGPWSEPVFLHEVDGIDPSFFFDEDGRAWLVNNGPPPENRPLYPGHRAIWLQEFDPVAQKLIGPRTIIVNGGTDLAKRPIWIEGPHIFKRAGWYYLICAEGGTEERHSEVVFRSHEVTGPWLPWSGNPILTQRDLPPDRANPVSCAGHADFVELPDGSCWSVFLACQPYSGNLSNTGRETFLLPVHWTADNWPVILPPATAIDNLYKSPKLARDPIASKSMPLTGTITLRDEFNSPSLSPQWSTLRGPGQPWISLESEPGCLTILAHPERLDGKGTPSLVARRQQHAHCTATTLLTTPPKGVSAGLAAFLNESHSFFFGVRQRQGVMEIFLERTSTNFGSTKTETLATTKIQLPESITLRLSAAGRSYAFAYSVGDDHWQTIANDVDGSILSPQIGGGFVGTMLGLYARVDQ